MNFRKGDTRTRPLIACCAQIAWQIVLFSICVRTFCRRVGAGATGDSGPNILACNDNEAADGIICLYIMFVSPHSICVRMLCVTNTLIVGTNFLNNRILNKATRI